MADKIRKLDFHPVPTILFLKSSLLFQCLRVKVSSLGGFNLKLKVKVSLLLGKTLGLTNKFNSNFYKKANPIFRISVMNREACAALRRKVKHSNEVHQIKKDPNPRLKALADHRLDEPIRLKDWSSNSDLLIANRAPSSIRDSVPERFVTGVS